ncbi:MAG: hypothetical protein R3D98_07170 [Candidatus Krumholzibacteriia bacterium]
MKLNQYCSVCKKHLDMDVIPTDDGGDDGVIWLRCPECQGFLPKFTGEGLKPAPAADPEPAPSTAEPAARGTDARPVGAEADLDDEDAEDLDDEASEDDAPETPTSTPASEREPLAEYAARLAESDPTTARPYRPGQTYAVGDVIHHLAYDDLGVVVAKEDLPGGRKAVKVFFEKVGVVRLIEQDPGSR